MAATMRNVALFILATSVAAEHQLRSQPKAQVSLAVDAVKEAPKKQKSLVSVVATPEDDHKRRDKEDRKAVTDFKAFGLMNTGEIFMTFALWLVFYIILAMYYHKYVLYYAPEEEDWATKERTEHFRDFQDWRSGLCGCAQYPGITFWSCCCPGIRWADTMDEVGIHRFYHGFFMMTCLWALMFIPIATVFVFLIVVCYMAVQRQAIRAKFDFDEQGGSSVVADCLTYLFCMCCAVAQEARHTREACLAGHPAILQESQRSPR